ncbi:MAG: STAS domain-containing protein [Planctomycetota bacterium]
MQASAINQDRRVSGDIPSPSMEGQCLRPTVARGLIGRLTSMVQRIGSNLWAAISKVIRLPRSDVISPSPGFPGGSVSSDDHEMVIVFPPTHVADRDEFIRAFLNEVEKALQLCTRHVAIDLRDVQRIDTALIAAMLLVIRRIRSEGAFAELVGAPVRLVHLLEIYRLAGPLRHAGILRDAHTWYLQVEPAAEGLVSSALPDHPLVSSASTVSKRNGTPVATASGPSSASTAAASRSGLTTVPMMKCAV